MERFNKIGEEDVGITEYIDSSNKGFKCVLKHRYSDFIVNEIDIDGNVITGGMIKTNAIDASKWNVTSLSAICATIGELKTADTGARVVIKDNLIQVYDNNNVLRVKMGVWS